MPIHLWCLQEPFCDECQSRLALAQEHWLRRPLFITRSGRLADWGSFQWRDLPNGCYGLSLLGLLNGIFTPFGWCLVLVVTDPDGKPSDLKPGALMFKRKWW
jgi:hypothetical protein